MGARLYKLAAGPELGLVGTLVFVGLYIWPFLTFTRPSATFQFLFSVWALHVAFIGMTSFAHQKLAALEPVPDSRNDNDNAPAQ